MSIISRPLEDEYLTVAITGGAGFLGHHLAVYLKEIGYNVLVIDDLSRVNSENLESLERRNVPLIKEDILSENLPKILKANRPEKVIHTAALTSVEESLEKPDLYNKMNATGTLRMLEASHKAGVKHFIYISSAAVYDEPKYLPIDEEHPLKPKSPYGASKLAGEAYVLYPRNISLKTTILRLFNIYGQGQNPSYAGVITKFLKSINEKKPPTIFGDGEQTRDFIHVSDVAKAIEKALESETEGIYNIGDGKPISINNLAETMISIAGLDLKPEHAPPRRGEIKHSYANINKATLKLKWKPETGLEDGLRQLIDSNN